MANNLTRTCARADVHGYILVCEEPHVAILVVVHVDFDGASQTARRGVVEVGRAPAAVPVVCGGVLVCDGDDGEGRGGRRNGEDAVGGFGVVF